MIDDMQLAGFAERTRDVYIQAVRRLAAHYMRSPDVLSEEEVRAYLLHLRDERGIARGTFKTNHGGIRFLRLPRRAWRPERADYRSVRGRMPVLSGYIITALEQIGACK
jgi:sarcosine oxidase delta subunit